MSTHDRVANAFLSSPLLSRYRVVESSLESDAYPVTSLFYFAYVRRVHSLLRADTNIHTFRKAYERLMWGEVLPQQQDEDEKNIGDRLQW